MERKNINGMLIRVSKALAPDTRMNILEIDSEVLTVRFISQRFRGVSMLKRFDFLSELVEKHAEPLAMQYTLVYEAFTDTEMLEINALNELE